MRLGPRTDEKDVSRCRSVKQLLYVLRDLVQTPPQIGCGRSDKKQDAEERGTPTLLPTRFDEPPSGQYRRERKHGNAIATGHDREDRRDGEENDERDRKRDDRLRKSTTP